MRRFMFILVAMAGLAGAGAASTATQTAPQATPAGLAGTSWQLVRFQGGDDSVLTPDDGSKYTLVFESDGRASVRLDCNRGRGMWKSPEPNQLQLGPLALTRATCPPGSLHDRMAKDWGYVRSFTLRDGHLFLALMADAGVYEFEPMADRPPRPSTTSQTPPTTAPSTPATGHDRPPLSRVQISDVDEPGEKLEFGGRVLDYQGRPLSKAAVVAYHTDREGLYSRPGAPSRVPRLRGVTVTDSEGRFDFITIRPGSYPDGTQPAHIHIAVTAPAHHVRHLEYWFRGDPRIPASARDGAEGNPSVVIVDLTKNAEGAWSFRHDIRLEAN